MDEGSRCCHGNIIFCIIWSSVRWFMRSKQLRRRRRWQLQKNNRFNDQNNSSARASRSLVHFFHVHCTTTTWNLLRTWTYDDEFFFLFLNLNKNLKNSTPGKVACIWHLADLATERERQLKTVRAIPATGLTNGRAANWAPEVVLCPFRALSRRQMTFPSCC